MDYNFYIEDMEAIAEEMLREEDAHFYFTINDFVSLNLYDAMCEIRKSYPMAYDVMLDVIDEIEEEF